MERTGVGRNRGEQAIGDWFGDRPFGDFQQAEDQFAGGGFAGGNPVDVGVTRVAFVMVDVDEQLAVVDAGATVPRRSKLAESVAMTQSNFGRALGC